MTASSPSQRWIDLGQPWFNGMPTSPVHGVPRFSSETVWRDEDRECEVRVTKVAMGAHVGTHLDAARHFFPDGHTIDQYPPEAFVGAGVVLDVPRTGPSAVTAEHLEQAGPAIEPGDLVFIRFGYGERFAEDCYHEHPYLDLDAADFLVERRVRLVGTDTLTPEIPGAFRCDGFDFPIHRRLLGHGILVAENLGAGLGAVVGRRLTLGVVPLRILEADGAPAVAFALADGTSL